MRFAWLLTGLALISGSVQGAAEGSLAEPPHWPVAFKLPEALGGKVEGKGSEKADVGVWTPPGAERIRAMLIVPNNSDSKHVAEHGKLREVAAKHEMGIVYLRHFQTAIEHRKEAPTEADRIFRVLDRVAEETGIEEFRHAPWITFGKSSRGEFPFRMAWLFPKRTIASISYHAETPTWPMLEWAKLDGETLLHLSANGETEWGGTWFNHVRPALLNYRARTAWLPHQVVARGVGHGDYPDAHGSSGWGKPVQGETTSCLRIWDYIALFIDKALPLRVPADAYPTKGPVELKPVDPATGYLIDPFAVEDLFGVPHLTLEKGPNGYLPNAGVDDAPVSGHAAFAPPEGFEVPEGVPVVTPDTEVQGLKDWVLADQGGHVMKADPMLDLGDLAKLTPKPGDTVTIDGRTLTFRRIEPKQVAPEGGVRVPGSKYTLLAYAVIEVPKETTFKLRAPFTAATRQQVVLAGVGLRDKQVVELAPGRYPLLVAVRMAVKWGRIGPWFETVTAEEVALAREIQAEADRLAAAKAKLESEGGPSLDALIRPAADVPEDERKRMFWVADRDQAEAWLELHNVKDRNVKIGGAK